MAQDVPETRAALATAVRASRHHEPVALRLWFTTAASALVRDGRRHGGRAPRHGALPGAHRAGPSSDTSEDGWECDGWRRELGDSEVAEAYMDAKFGG